MHSLYGIIKINQKFQLKTLFLIGFSLIFNLGILYSQNKEEYNDIQLEMNFDFQCERLWNDIPSPMITGEEDNIHILRGEPVCAGNALNKFRKSIASAEVGPAAIKGLKTSIKLGKELMKIFGLGFAGDVAGDIADLITKALESSGPEDFAQKLGEFAVGKAAKEGIKKGVDDYLVKLGGGELAKGLYKKLFEHNKEKKTRIYKDDKCGDIIINFYIEYSNGTVYLCFDANGDCKCKIPENMSDDQKLGFWYIFGKAELVMQKPILKGKTLIVNFTLGRPEYYVNATCGCPSNTTQDGGNQPYPPKEEPKRKRTQREVDEINCANECYSKWKAWIDLKGEVAETVDKINYFGKELNKDQRDLESVNSQIPDEEKRISEIEKSLNSYKKHAEQFKDRITELKRGLSDAQTKLSTLKNKQKALEKSISELDQILKNLNKKLDGLTTDEAKAKDAYDECVKNCFKKAEQGYYHPVPGKTEKISYGAGFGFGYNDLTLRDDDGYTQKLSGLNVLLGALAIYQLNEMFSIVCALNILNYARPSMSYSSSYNSQGYSYKSEGTYSISLTGVNLEPSLAYNIDNLSLMLGPAINYNHSASQSTSGTTTTTTNGKTTVQTVDSKSPLSAGMSAAIAVSAGYSTELFGYSVFPKLSINIPVSNTITRDPKTFPPASKMLSVGIGIYYLFNK